MYVKIRKIMNLTVKKVQQRTNSFFARTQVVLCYFVLFNYQEFIENFYYFLLVILQRIRQYISHIKRE